VNLPSSEKRQLRREVRLATAGLPTAYVLEAMVGRLQTPRGLLELETVDGFLIRVGRTRYMSPDRPPAYELGPNPTRLDLINCLGATYGMKRGGKLVVSYTNQTVVDPVVVIDQFNASSLVWPLPRS
jgi:hypothetical protein